MLFQNPSQMVLIYYYQKIGNRYLLNYNKYKMLRYSRKSSLNKQFELHMVIRDFKRFEEEKSVLRNRIRIMQKKQSSNMKKAKSLQAKLNQIRTVKQQRIFQQRQICNQINLIRDQQRQKKKQMRRRIQEERKNIQTSKRFYSEFKTTMTKKARNQSRLNSERISQIKCEVLTENQKRRKKILTLQELGKTKIKNFNRIKLESLKSDFKEKLVDQIKLNENSQEQLALLQELQKEILNRYSESVKSMINSRSKLQKISSIRG